MRKADLKFGPTPSTGRFFNRFLLLHSGSTQQRTASFTSDWCEINNARGDGEMNRKLMLPSEGLLIVSRDGSS